MVDNRAQASAERVDTSAIETRGAGGAHAFRPGVHRRRRNRSALSLSTAAAVMISAVIVMGGGRSAVADENPPAPQPTESAVAGDPTSAPTDSATAQPTASPTQSSTTVRSNAKGAELPTRKLTKAAAHKESVSRASRAGRRGTKAYNIVYTSTYARTAMGWSQREVKCLTKLWAGESNFRTMARNRHSGAYGIPQALPGRKMRFEGKDWKTNPDTQIRWGVKYVKVKYATPCKALKVKRARGWY